MASVIADLLAKFGLDTSNFITGADLVHKRLGDIQKDADKTGDQFENIGKKLSGIAASLGIAALGTAALSSATKFDDAYRLISNTTGATGAKLDALESSFKNLYSTSAASADVIASAVSVISQRTGLVGPALEMVTKGMMSMAKVAKSDVASIAPLMTRVMGDWSISTGKSADSMKYLTSVSQQTGAQIPQLLERIVQYGAPMRQLGLSFEETAAMMARWEAEGVNVETVMAGLRKAVSQFTKDGTDPATGLKAVLEGIKTGSFSAGQAMALFGAKAGPDTLAAIKEGRFDELLTHQLQTVATAAKDSEVYPKSLATEWTIFRHKTDIALAPLGRLIMDAFTLATPYMEKLALVIQSVSAAFGDMPKWAQYGVVGVGVLLAIIPPILVAVAGLVTAFGILGVTAGTAWGIVCGPVGWVVGAVAVAALTAGIVKAAQKFDELQEKANLAKIQQAALTTQIDLAANAHNKAAAGANTHKIALEGLGKASEQLNDEIAETVTAGEFIAKTFNALIDLKLSQRVDDATSSLKAGVQAWVDSNFVAKDYLETVGLLSTEFKNLRLDMDPMYWVDEMDAALQKPIKRKPYDVIGGMKPEFDTPDKPIISKSQKHTVHEVSRIFSDLSKGISETIVNGGKFKDVIAGIGKQAEESFLRIALTGAVKPFEDAMTKFAGNMFGGKGLFSNLKTLGTDLMSVFKGASKAIDATTTSIQAAGSATKAISAGADAAGGAAKAGGGLASVGSAAGSAASAGATAIVGAVAGVVSAVSGVIGNFQMMAMNKSLDILVKHTLQLVMIGEATFDGITHRLNEVLDRLYEIRTIGVRVFTTDQPVEVIGTGGGSGLTVNVSIANVYGGPAGLNQLGDELARIIAPKLGR